MFHFVNIAIHRLQHRLVSNLVIPLSYFSSLPKSRSLHLLGQSVQTGQLGNATCNIERLKTIVGLEKSATSIQKATNATGS